MDYEYKTEPFDHQRAEFELSRDMEHRALFWEQGTGKTKPTIDTAAWLYETGKIDAVIIIAPSGVHRNWLTDEIPTHLPDRVARQSKAVMWDARKAGNKAAEKERDALIAHKGLSWLFMSYDSVMTDRGKEFLWRVLRNRRCLYVLDEGHYIKTPGAKRSKRLVASGRYARYRRLLTGTPVATGPFDLYTQVKFLAEQFWERLRLGSFHVFKFRYGEWYTAAEFKRDHGYDPKYDKLIDYKNIDELKGHVDLMGSRVTKDDALPDLPPKLYTRRYFTLTPEQTALYTRLRDEYYAELSELYEEVENAGHVDAELAIVRMLRLQQIISGYVGTDSEEEPTALIPGKNPLLDEVEEVCATIHRPAIIWCRFTKTIDLLMDRLGPAAVRYDGQLDEDEAERSKLAFQAGDAQWFIGNAQKGATGLTLTQAKYVLYAENSFRYVDRVQSEDRAHRIGQTDTVQYLDFEARLPGGETTVARHIINNLRGKMDISSQITGDKLRDWI